MKNNNSSTSQDDSTYLISLDNCLSAQHNDVDNLDPEYLDTGEETGKLDEEIQYLLLDNTYDAENCPLSESDITILLKLLKTKSDQYNQQQDKNTSVLYSVSNSDVEQLFQIINLKQEIINKTINMNKNHRFLIPYCLDNNFHWNLLDIDITTDVKTENTKVICQMWDTDGKAKPLEISLFKKLTNLFGEIESLPNVECTNLKDSYAYLPDLQYNNNCGIVIALFAHYFLYEYSNWEDIDNLISGSTTSDLNLSETEFSNPKFTLRQKVNKLIKENCNQEDKTNYCNLERANINNVTITDFEFNTTKPAHIKIKEKLQSISFENILSLYNSTSNNVDMDAIRELATSIKYTKDNIDFIFKDSLHEELNPIAVNAINKVFTERNSAIDSINSTSNNLPGIIDTRNNIQNIGMQESFENDNQQNISNISPRKSKQAKNNLYSTESGPSFNLTTMKNELAGVIDNSGTILNYEFTEKQSDNIHKVLREMLSKKFLYNHQADAVILAIAANFNKTGFLLADAPGIGKTRTIIALSYLYKVLEEKNTDSLAIICVQNQAQKEFFQREIKVLSESLNKDSISDLKVLTKSEISKDENSDDLSKCLILTIDEVHNFYTQQDIINSLNEKKDTSLKKLMGKINRENTGLVLASATPTHNLEETKLILRLIFPYNKPAKVEQILSAKDDSTLSKNISYLLPPLLSEYGVIVTRMLRDNAYISEGFGYNQQKKYLLEQILTDEIKDKLEEYNKIISEINNIRSQLHTHNKPLIFNLVFFSLVNRLQDDILIRYKIAETRKAREVNKEYRCIICINEYNDRAVITSLKKSLGKNNLSNINLGNLEKYYNDFQLITKKSFDSGQNDVTFNPATIDAKMGIVVLTRKELTGTNKNTLLTNNNPVFRNANFHLELCHIGHARSEVELDQASGRLTRASNADDVEYGKHYSVSQINFARFSSRNHDDQRLHLQSFKNFTTNQGKLQKILEYASNQQQKISEIFGKNVSKDRLLLETMFLQTEHVKKFDLFLTSLERQIQIYEDNILKQERDLIYDDDGIVFITKNNDDSDNKSTNIICDIQASNNFLFIFNMMFESQPNYISDNNKNTFVCWNIRKTRFDKISSLLNPEILHIIAHKFNQNSALSVMDLLQKESTSGINDHSLDTTRGITSNRGNTTFNSINNRHQNQPAHKRKFIQSNSEKQYIPPRSMNKRTKDESEARIRHQENISRNSSINYEDYDHFSTCREYDALMTEYLNSNHNFENCLGNFLVSSGYEKLGKINGITHGGLNIYHYFVKNNNEFGTLKYLKQAEEYRKATQETEYNWLGILTSMNDGHASPYRGWSLLHFAVYESDLESVTYICQEAQQIINLKTKDNFQDNSTALHIAFSTLNEEHNKNKKNKDSNKINVTVNIIKTLLKNGADPQILEKTYRGQNKHITDLCSTDIIQKYFSTEKELVEKLLTRNRDRQAHTARDHGEHSNSDVSSDSESFHNLYILQQAAANILQQGNSLNHLTKELGKANAKEDVLKENSSTRKQEANIGNDYFLHNFRKSIENELEKQKAEQEARKIRIDDLLRRDINTTDTNTYEILTELIDIFISLTPHEKDLKSAVLEKIYSICIEKKPVLFNPYNQKLVDFLRSLCNEDKKRFID
ncbi:MAG: hypothetical protein VX335_02345, partial [Pseudomonadota bacterium]|nr:hypothetical protein [Pseudomonadota bacterium]